jgi:hypothetical protein
MTKHLYAPSDQHESIYGFRLTILQACIVPSTATRYQGTSSCHPARCKCMSIIPSTGSRFSYNYPIYRPYVPQHLSPNADLAPPNSYPQSFTHDFGTQCGSQSVGPPYQPLPSMAHSQSPALTGFGASSSQKILKSNATLDGKAVFSVRTTFYVRGMW